MNSKVDLTGMRFGKLAVIGLGVPHRSPSRVQRTWECLCDCGKHVTVQRGALRGGSTKSCGCSYKDVGIRNRTARYSNLSEYTSWFQMKQRCTNPNNQDYDNYGGRGISMCHEWLVSFDAFFRDMGAKPGKEYSIDRINCDLGYSKGNCRWATPLMQSRNRRHTKFYQQKELQNGA